MSLAEASEARKARLEALRKRRAGEDVDVPLIHHRNFDPASRTLRKREGEDVDMNDDTVEKNVEGLAERIIREDEERRAQELNIFNIAPKRANWDLKRELEKKVARLDRKTQEAIHTLIRQRLAEQRGETDDLAAAIRTQADEAGNDSDDD